MTRKGHTEEQIIAALQQAEAAAKAGELCRKLGISQAWGYRSCANSVSCGKKTAG